ncbi:MAG: methionine--tRNA ligase [Phycisphaerae bacterium]|nr:methionine--tRNA ligase [Phycisphaerae bacterium]
MSDTYYVTTPIYYVNDVPHIGHSYTTIAADVLARFFRAAGRDVHFLTGTDEHGIKIVKAATEKGTTPQALADDVVTHFRRLWVDLNISNDDFIRTTEPRHENRVQTLIRELVARDEIYLATYEGWYDETQEEYVTESTARANDYKSEISGKPLVRYSEENWFFRLKKWVPKLIEHIEKVNPKFVQPDARRNEVLSKLRMGMESGELADLCISRNKEKLPWGVEMPNDPNHVVYVWIDALSNYYSALGLPAIGDEFDNRDAKYWPADVHLIGKDILWFHAVYWPCFLMALDIPMPKCVFAHGWWTSEGQKMSKSLGNFVSREKIAEYCEEYSRDVYRYYLLRAVTFGSDGDFAHDMVQQVYNSDLANGVGNLLSRTLKMISKYFDGEIPAPEEDVEDVRWVKTAAEALHDNAVGWMDAFAFSKYLEAINALIGATNKFIDDTEPFKLAKDEAQRSRLATVLYTCAEAVRIVLLYLAPVMPDKTTAGLERLGLTTTDENLTDAGRWGGLQPGGKVTPGDPLFPRAQN